jgi:phosphatidylglycerophosphatase A
MLAHPAHWIAQGFGSGLPAVAPGTWGSLFGWLSFIGLDRYLSDRLWAGVLIAAFVVGVLVCELTGRHLREMDHKSIVWDEIFAIWLVLWILPRNFSMQLGAFVLFRFFDILKPPPIGHFDRQWKNGFGVMFDDVLAAAFTLLTLAVVVRVPAFTLG